MPHRDRLERLHGSDAADFLVAYPDSRVGTDAGQVVHADLRGRQDYGNDALAAAARIPGVRQIVVDHTSVNDAGLARIGSASSLNVLQMSGCGAVGDAGIEALARLGLPLEHLDLTGTGATPACLASLFALPRLRELRLGGPRSTQLEPGTTWRDDWVTKPPAPGSRFMSMSKPGPVAQQVIDVISRWNLGAAEARIA